MSGPPGARAWVELDLDAIRSNVREIARTAGVPLLAVVKGDGYGHGASWVARAALDAGAVALGVATPAEALALRKARISAPIQVLGSCLDDELDAAVEAKASITLHEPQDLNRVRDAAWRAGRPLPVQVKVDVGMARHGVATHQALGLLAAAKQNAGVRLEGLMTHLPCANDADLARTEGQVARFAHLVSRAARHRLLPGRVHAAASAALFRLPEARFNQVRSGIAVVGLDPQGRLQEAGASLTPALSIRARVMRTRMIRCGASAGYGARWTAKRDSLLAIVGIGYADGVPYGLTGRQADVLLHGTRCPVVGTVMMDYLLVDASGVPAPVRSGDVATFVGADGARRIRLEEQARKAGLIPYALACGLGRRLEQVVANVRAPVTKRWTPRLAA